MRERVASSHRCCCAEEGVGVLLLLVLRLLCHPASKQRGDRGFYGREGVGLSVKNWTRSGLPAHAAHTLRHGLGKPQF
jgi:hypothetical protein